MPRIDLAQTVPLFQVYNPASRLQIAPAFTWRYLCGRHATSPPSSTPCTAPGMWWATSTSRTCWSTSGRWPCWSTATRCRCAIRRPASCITVASASPSSPPPSCWGATCPPRTGPSPPTTSLSPCSCSSCCWRGCTRSRASGGGGASRPTCRPASVRGSSLPAGVAAGAAAARARVGRAPAAAAQAGVAGVHHRCPPPLGPSVVGRLGGGAGGGRGALRTCDRSPTTCSGAPPPLPVVPPHRPRHARPVPRPDGALDVGARPPALDRVRAAAASAAVAGRGSGARRHASHRRRRWPRPGRRARRLRAGGAGRGRAARRTPCGPASAARSPGDPRVARRRAHDHARPRRRARPLVLGTLSPVFRLSAFTKALAAASAVAGPWAVAVAAGVVHLVHGPWWWPLS